MREYKGFYVFNDTYYILVPKVSNIDNYEFISGYLFEKKENNRESIKLTKYIGNGSIYEAIDVYIKYKDLEIPKPPHTLILDYCFNELKLDAKEFIQKWGNRIEYNNICFESFNNYYIDLRSKDSRMELFITDEKIKEFWEINKKTQLIKYSKGLQLDYLI